MITLLGFLAAALIAYATAWAILSPKQKAQIANFFSSLILAGLHGATTLLTDAEPYIQPIIVAFRDAIARYGTTFATELNTPFADLAKGEFLATEAVLRAAGVSTPDNAVGTAAEAVATAFGFGLTSAAEAATFEAIFPEKLNVLNGVGPMLAKMAGFDEVVAAIRDPLYENAFGKSAEYHYRSIFKPELPDEADAVTWHSRRLLTDAQLQTIFNYSGLKPEYEAAFVASAYRSIQPRAIATAVQDSPFPRAQMQSMLEFYGARPQDVTLLLDLFELQSTRNVRNQYLSATVTAAERGTLTPAEVDSNLTDLNFSAQAKHWVQLTIATRKLEQLAELYRKSISEAYKYSLITDAEYVPALQAIGIAAADANAHYAVDSEAKLGKEAAAAARAAARLAAETTRAASKAALLNYAEHNIDEIALAAALAAAGLPVQVIPFAVDVAILRRQASQRLVFGKLVNPRDVVLLREQVAAIKEQVIKKLLDTTTARAQLQGLGLPNVNIEDLLAEWAAQALKTVLPVQ